jgi:hypothetical protein
VHLDLSVVEFFLVNRQGKIRHDIRYQHSQYLPQLSHRANHRQDLNRMDLLVGYLKTESQSLQQLARLQNLTQKPRLKL